MIPQTSYDFGGLIDTKKEITTEKETPLQNSTNSQDWANIRCLLTEESDSDLKESIHCGPDIRATKYSCTMLQNFGREIQ